MSVYQKDVSKIFKLLLLKYETQIALNKKRDIKMDRFSIIELTILDHLRHHEDVILNDVLELVTIKRGKVLAILKKLMEAGLVEKHLNKQDRRSTFLKLTAAGQLLMNDYDKHEAEFLDFVLKDMTINEEKAIVKFLSKINQTDYMK